jgi:hypothetical protein
LVPGISFPTTTLEHTITTNPPAIDLTPCASSQISAFGYDAATQTLAIQFPGRGNTSSLYHYADVPAEVFEQMKAAPSKGTFFGEKIRGRFAYVNQPDPNTGITYGLSQAQESKYTTSAKDGRLVNRASGKAIPDDEPVFVLRAQDVHALPALLGYMTLVENDAHRAALQARALAFEAFREAHPERMKFPDTAAA